MPSGNYLHRPRTEKTKESIRKSMQGNSHGFQKDHTPWCKGKHLSKLTRDKMSEKAKLRIGDKNSFYGKKHSKKTIENMRLVKLGKTQSKETIEKRIKKGKDHYNWKGGITPLNILMRAKANYKLWRESIFERDDYTCQNPDCPFCDNKRGVKLHPHHLKAVFRYPELVFNIDNGISYCEDYHLKSGLHRELKKVGEVA